jgi:hypothetical protein
MRGVDLRYTIRPGRGLRVTLVVVAIAAVGGSALWIHGGGAGALVIRVSIRTIVQNRAHWLGRRVRVRGALLRFSDPRSGVYGAVDDRGFRIGIRHLDGWATLVGHSVVAVGTVEFDPSFGLYLERPEVHLSG